MFDPKKKAIELISAASENEVLEFKEANNDFDLKRIGKYFSALSNEANLKAIAEAWLVFGVKDKGHDLVNTRYRHALGALQKVKSEISAGTTGSITFTEIYEVEVEVGKRVVLFRIPAAPRGIPIAWKGHYFARDNEELKPLNIEKIERIRAQANKYDWSAALCDGASLSDLSSEAIRKARELYKKKNHSIAEESDTWNDATFLNKVRVTIGGQVTNTAILLLGKPESIHFISPAVSKISWILRSKEGTELDYEHFTSPIVLSVDKIYSKIRNLKYRYMSGGSLFPEEVFKYDPYVIREALNNCIAHQDYELGGKINIVENEDDSLVFSNLGSFLPLSVENVIHADAPSEFYRNRFLVDAMVNLSMIDTVGSGIKKMFISQKEKFFPLPEYDLSGNKVTVAIVGKVLDLNYARKLAQIPELTLETIMLLDKVQKKKPLSSDEAKTLRSLGLIEGIRPNLYVSSRVANKTNEKTDYMKLRGIDDEYCKKMIVDYLKRFKSGMRADFEMMLLDKLPSNLNDIQKRSKIRNILQSLKRQGLIKLTVGKTWILA